VLQRLNYDPDWVPPAWLAEAHGFQSTEDRPGFTEPDPKDDPLRDHEAYSRKLLAVDRANRSRSALETYNLTALRRQVEVLRAAGVEPIYGVSPIVFVAPEVLALDQRASCPHLLPFHLPKSYPRLFAVEKRVDASHLRGAGAVEFSQVLAPRLAEILKAGLRELPLQADLRRPGLLRLLPPRRSGVLGPAHERPAQALAARRQLLLLRRVGLALPRADLRHHRGGLLRRPAHRGGAHQGGEAALAAGQPGVRPRDARLLQVLRLLRGVGHRLLHLLGLKVEPMRLGIVLPIGISFYTFQSLSYTIDVYRGRLATRKSFLDYALFVSCFPQLLAGPIMRAAQYPAPARHKRRLADVEVRASLTLFFFGFVKKTCVADRLALVVGQVFANPDAVGSRALDRRWLFIVQLYCDFSGYSDMAKATSGLLGYRLVDNFRHPFVARSVNDFWSRWHISLTTWIRDYLYLYLDSVSAALGGARSSRWRIYFALFGVYTAVGLWHGASFNFILFGAYAGLFVVLETAGKLAWITKRTYLAHAYVLLFVTFLGSSSAPASSGTSAPSWPACSASRGPRTQPVNPLWALVLPPFLSAK
jgi:hypothetical protein